MSHSHRRRKSRRKQTTAKWHKYVRLAHAYVSAFAFMALIFFAASGLLLNHPEWFEIHKTRGPADSVTLASTELSEALNAPDPTQTLGALAAAKLPLVGRFQDAEVYPDEAYLRYAGVKGSSDVTIDLATGQADFETKRTGMVEILHNLHRGKDAGATWSMVIDVSAVLILALSLFGFSLFLFMRVRLMTGLSLVASSTALLGVIYLWFVP